MKRATTEAARLLVYAYKRRLQGIAGAWPAWPKEVRCCPG